ncbi:head-tail joining protein [Roseinatronobacter sp.]|uniref:head-tail joining protein n=1 Tax=Roseinatronobacter sp. TaxID=1945755 RepID=UPI0025F1B2D9|nr:hypothetical protein [Roseibaca sp.]
MSVFDAALGRIFDNPAMAVAAVWISATTSEERTIRVMRRAPDRITEFGAAKLFSDTMIVDARVIDLPDPRPGDLIVMGAESFTIQGEPMRDRDRLIWSLDLRPS